MQAICCTSLAKLKWMKATAAVTGALSCLSSARASAPARHLRCLSPRHYPWMHPRSGQPPSRFPPCSSLPHNRRNATAGSSTGRRKSCRIGASARRLRSRPCVCLSAAQAWHATSSIDRALTEMEPCQRCRRTCPSTIITPKAVTATSLSCSSVTILSFQLSSLRAAVCEGVVPCGALRRP